MKSRFGVLSAFLFGGCLAPTIALGQVNLGGDIGVYPSRPIRMVVPQAPGGNTDFIGRQASQYISQALNGNVVVDNRPGAGGNLGNEIVASATPDGYTLLTASPAFVTSPALYKKLAYDAIKDFAPIGMTALVPQVLAVHPSVPAKNVQELIQLARDKPGGLNYAAPGAGSGPHVTAARFVSMANVKIEHIAYKGTGPALIDLLAGRVQMQFGGLPAMIPHIRSGRIRALGISTARRSAALPELPSIAEQGVTGFDTAGWVGMAAPAGTPRAIVALLSQHLEAFKKDAAAQKRFASRGAEFTDSSPEKFVQFIKREIPEWKKVLKPVR
ncbi:MAG: Bug family tripartite tricarboxylate transporter substrate binding protein [Burkholderiales bacterium]